MTFWIEFSFESCCSVFLLTPSKGSDGGAAKGSFPLPKGSKSLGLSAETAKGSSLGIGAAANGSAPEFEAPNGSSMVSILKFQVEMLKFF